MNPACLASLAICLSTAICQAATVSTAFGNGADVQLSAGGGDVATAAGSNGTSMNTRKNTTNVNEVIALRFDLTDFDLTLIQNASVNVFMFRDDGSNRTVNLWGLASNATATTGVYTAANWAEDDVTYNTMPGLIFDGTTLGSDVNLPFVTNLGQIVYPANTIGTVQTFSSAAITEFLNTYDDSQVTFLLSAGNTSNGQGRIASKEAADLNAGALPQSEEFYAPYLSFDVIPEPSSALLSLFGALALAFRRRR